MPDLYASLENANRAASSLSLLVTFFRIIKMNNNKLVAKQKQYQELSTNIKTPKTKLHVLKEDLCKALGKMR